MTEIRMRVTDIVKIVIGVTAMLILFACSDAAQEATIDKTIPTNVLAQSGDGEVIMSWDPVEGAEQYNACWAYVTIKDCNNSNPRVIYKENVGALDPASNLIVWKHTNITNSTTYRYVILAYAKSWGNSPISVNVDGKPQGIEPPAEVSIAANGLIPTISWTKALEATKYNIYMANSFGVTPENFVEKNGMKHTVSASSLSFTHSSLAAGEYFSFVVTTERDIGGGVILESVQSQEIRLIPRAITAGDELYMPNDFSVSSGNSKINNGQVVEKFLVEFSNPCDKGRRQSNQYEIYWDTQPFNTNPVCDPNNPINCALDLTPICYPSPQNSCTTPQIENTIKDLNPGSYYYFAMATTYTSLCGGENLNAPFPITDYSSVIGLKTPGARITEQPIISAVPTKNVNNALTITVANHDSGINPKYNLYMAANSFCEVSDLQLTITNYIKDKVWGMVHSDIPPTYTHVALPAGINFCFIVTSVNKVGVESIASDIAYATPGGNN